MDGFLYGLRQPPSPKFSAALEKRLNATRPVFSRRFVRIAASLAVFTVTASAFASPAVRAAGASVLAALGVPGFVLTQFEAAANAVPMRHYVNAEAKFEIDVPTSWYNAPPVYSNSKWEVIRFLFEGHGPLSLVVFYLPLDPKVGVEGHFTATQALFESQGKSGFVRTDIKIGTKNVIRMDYRQPMPGWVGECRHYFIADGDHLYILGFGTPYNREAMFPLFDRIARSFVATR